MSLPCPLCNKALQITRYEGEKVGLCADCNGFFMGSKNLRNIEKSHEVSVPMESVSGSGINVEGVKKCPKCKLDMQVKSYGELGAAEVDYCQRCGGIWLDPGELERIQLYYEAVHDSNLPKGATAKHSFACPKCGVAQAKSDECSSCGIIFARFHARQTETEIRQERVLNASASLEEKLNNIRSFEIDQQYHLTEAIFSFERKNEYSISIQPESAVKGKWHMEELNASGLSILGRNLFGLLYTFTMELTDDQGKIVFRIYRKARLYYHSLDMHDETGLQTGRISRRFSFINRVVSARNMKNTEMLRLVGPVWKPWTFYLYNGRNKVGVVSKKWSGLLKEAYTDADKFSLRFTTPLDPERKRLALGALMLVDSLYFEGKKGFLGHLFSAPGLQLLALVISVGVIASLYPG